MGELLLKNLSKKFGTVEAVKGVSLSIHDGEFVVLLGPSGCGKTTTLRMIAGLEEITGGEIYLDGRLLNEVLPGNRDIAMVFQNYALYPHMTVYKNMAFGLRMRSTPKQEIANRVKRAADILGIAHLLQRYPRELSGGQRQRVAVGRAIVRDPRVFLFDEPLSNLDAKLRVQTRVELLKLHRQLAATSVYVTHDQVEAMTMGDRIVIMLDGTVQQVGPPIEVYQKPANRFVAAFVGSPSMNFLPIRMEFGRREALPEGTQLPDHPAAREGRRTEERGEPGCSPRRPPGEPAAETTECGRKPASRDGRDRRGRGLGHLPGCEYGGCVHHGARRGDGTRRSGAGGQPLSRPGANPPFRPRNRDQPPLKVRCSG